MVPRVTTVLSLYCFEFGNLSINVSRDDAVRGITVSINLLHLKRKLAGKERWGL